MNEKNLTEYEICANLDQCLQRLTIEKNLAVATPRMRERAIQKSHLYCFDESQSIKRYSVAMYVNHRFFHWQRVHVFTERFFEAGLFQKWTMDSELNTVAIANQQVQKISLQILLGALFVCSLVLFWAIVALIVEIIAHKQSRRKIARFRMLWTFLECVFDNERYVWLPNNRSNRIRSMLFTLLIIICYAISIILVYISLELNL